MVRNAIGVVAGLIVAWSGVAMSVAVVMWALGPERVFVPNLWTPSNLYIMGTLVLGFIAALAGGATCQLISRDRRAAGVLVALILILGFVTGALAISGTTTITPVPERETGTTWEDVRGAHEQGWVRTPVWLLIVNPLIGAAGVVAGASLVPSRVRNARTRSIPGDDTRAAPPRREPDPTDRESP